MQLGTGYLGSAILPDSIQTITGGFTASGVDGLSSVFVPSVQSVGTTGGSPSPINSLQIQNSGALSGVQFPSLTVLGGSLQFSGNRDISTINGFDQLATVGGSVDLTGDIQTVSLPSLNSVGVGVNIQSSNPTFQCPSNIAADRTNGAIKGTGFVCAGNIPNPIPGVTGLNITANTIPPQHIGAAFSLQQSSISPR